MNDLSFKDRICIFCQDRGRPLEFSREHVIPESIEGQLVICNSVCIECNSKLGSHVDVQIQREPSIIEALNTMGRHAQIERVLRHNFTTLMESPAGTKLIARCVEGTVAPIPQPHPFYSMIYPENEARRILNKKVDRAVRDGRLSSEEAAIENNRFAGWENTARPGDTFDTALGPSIKIHREPFRVVHKAKEKARTRKLIAKMAYEFMFLLGGHSFLQDNVFSALRDCINEPSPHVSPVFCERIQATESALPTLHHSILFMRQKSGRPLVVVGFYGSVQYLLTISEPLPLGFFDALSKMTRCAQIEGVKYVYSIEDKIHALWMLTPHEKISLGSTSGVLCL